ncbi:C-type lectin-like [Eudromia elegans]
MAQTPPPGKAVREGYKRPRGGGRVQAPQQGPAETWASSCPPRWFLYRGHCYGFFAERKTWLEAERECERYGPRGRLASVHAFAERKVLAQYVAQHRQHEHVWMGLHDEEHERSWKWSDNSVLSFQSWAPGQPDNVDDDEDCAVLESGSQFRDWHDYSCSHRFPFVCKYRL